MEVFTDLGGPPLPELTSIWKRRGARFIWTGLLMAQYQLMNDLGLLGMKPDVIIGGLPVYHVNKIGHAASDEILKYRSTGGIFLAHQRGGKHTFKFTARLFGPNRLLMLKALETLQKVGAEEAKNIVYNLPQAATMGWSNEKQIDPNTIKNIDSGSDLINYTRYGDIDEQEYITHRTYPIITETRIYTDMYMETLTYSRDVKYGANVIEVNCLFRKFQPPLQWQATIPNPNQKREIKYYRTFIPQKELTFLRRMDYYFNLSWALMRMIRDFDKYYADATNLRQGQFSYEMGTLITLWLVHLSTTTLKYGGIEL